MAYTPTTNFVFSGGAYTPSFNFDFGSYVSQASGIIAATLDPLTAQFAGAIPVNGVIVVQLQPLTGLFEGRNFSVRGEFAATLEPLIGGMAGNFDPNVIRYTTAHFCSPSQDGKPQAHRTEFRRDQATYLPGETHADRDQATPLSAKTCAPRNPTAPTHTKTCAPVDAATPVSNQALAVFEQMTPVDKHQCALTDDATPLSTSTVAPVYQLELIFTESCHPIQDASVAVHIFKRRAWADGFNPYTPTPDFVLTYDPSYSPDAPFVWTQTALPIDLAESYQQAGIRHSTTGYWQNAERLELKKCSLQQDAMQALSGTSTPIDPPRPPVVDPPGHVTVTIPTKQVYNMLHTASVTLLNGTPILMNNLSLSHNADSFAWQFSGELLRKEDIALLTQSGGTPVQLVVTINGVVFKVIPSPVVEHNYSFGRRSITVPGVGLTALLDRPYEQPTSATQDAQLTIQQLAELNLVSGWTLNWSSAMPQPWVVPGGVYTHVQKTPIQALAGLAQDIGCILVPSRNSQEITITPRYPKLPWNFSQLSPDVVIPANAVTSVTHQTVIQSSINGVYVNCTHNQGNSGRIGWCRLNGTAGDNLASPVGNDFITDVIASRLLGERILSGYAPQPPIKSFTMPMDNATFPLLEIGQFIEVSADNQAARGIVNSVSLHYNLTASDVDVSQTITLGEETRNEWTFFKNLLPSDPLLFANLVSTNGESSLMTLLDGGVVRVRGTGTVGGKYFIRSGRIDGQAPDLQLDEIVL
jgi:hypothetical protein